MRAPVQFRVTNRLARNTGQQILVFRAPREGAWAENLEYLPWQRLNPSAAGGSHPFEERGTLQLSVENQATRSRSRTVGVSGNQTYRVSHRRSQGPVLELGGEPPYSSRQVAVRNTTDPPILLRAIWWVDDRPAVAQGGLNRGSTATFELDPILYFRVAGTEAARSRWKHCDVTSQIRYRVPAGARSVDVSWHRPAGDQGGDRLDFFPPSAPIDNYPRA